MYFDNGRASGGTATLGAPALSTTWLFAEGFTAPDYSETWILVANPADAPATATLRLRRPDGTGTDAGLQIPPRSRVGVRVNDQPGFDHTEFGADVAATSPVVAERVTYFRIAEATPASDPARLGTRLLSEDMTGEDVAETQRRMLAVGLDPGPVDGTFSDVTTHAAIAIEKWLGLPRHGDIGDEERAFLIAGRPPAPRQPSGNHVEIDIPRQVALLVHGGTVVAWWPTSTGSADNTPRGHYAVYNKVPAWDCGDVGCLYKPSYFVGGFAVHGYPSVPTYPASHGCARAPMAMAEWIYDQMPYGLEVFVYD